MRNKVRHIPAAAGEDAGKPAELCGNSAAAKEFPILFSAPMVTALLADRKHVTRRLSKQWLKVKAGDRLWVRETWTGTWCYEEMHLAYAADGSERTLDVPEVPGDYCLPKAAIKPGAWVSPFFLPRWACRIVLECEEDARPEWLRDISNQDAELEGVEEATGPGCVGRCWRTYCEEFHAHSASPRDSFASLWSTLHAKPGERWEDNPEVVRVGRFHRVTA